MATSTGQRVGIWVIAIALTAGTLLGFVAMMIAPSTQQAQDDLSQAEMQEQMEAYEEQARVQAEENAKISEPFGGYKTQKFDGDSATKVKTEVLKKGSGKTLTGKETIKANYFGWTADGKIFDSSRKDGKNESAEFMLEGGVIPGFTKGLTGAKVGSVVRITMPASESYGATEKEAGVGRPAGPLQFVVEILEEVKAE